MPEPDQDHLNDHSPADTRGADPAGSEALRETVVDRSYDAALDPHRLPELLKPWDRLFAPKWRLSPQSRRAGIEDSGLMGHVGRLDRILRLGARAARASEEDRALRSYARAAAFTLNGDLRVSATNSAAERMLAVRVGDPLSTLAIRDEDRRVLSRTVQAILSPAPSAAEERTQMVRARLARDEAPVLLLVYLVTPEAKPPFVVIATTDVHWTPETVGLLRDAFDLTEAEAEVMTALTRYHSLQDIAEARGRSLATVRSQIKSLQAKTEARGQGDLLRIALAVLDLAPPDPESTVGPRGRMRVSRGGVALKPLPFHSLTRPDGRRFDYLDYGDPKGAPVVFFSSSFGLCRWPAEAEARARATGVRVIAPIRSGYGGSTPLAADQDRVACFAGDVLALMDDLGIGAARFLVMDEDMVYLARLFKHAPERVTGVLGCAGYLPMSTPEQYERMGGWHRFVLGTARFAPQLLPFVVRAGFGMARQIGKPEFVRRVYGGSPADVALTRDRLAFEAVECGSDVVMSEGIDTAQAYAQEITILHRTDWRAEFEALRDRVPVVNLIGAEDQGITLETQAEYARDYPWIRVETVANAGTYLLFTHWPRVLDELDRLPRDHEGVRR